MVVFWGGCLDVDDERGFSDEVLCKFVFSEEAEDELRPDIKCGLWD